jgi:hypothetical protein
MFMAEKNDFGKMVSGKGIVFLETLDAAPETIAFLFPFFSGHQGGDVQLLKGGVGKDSGRGLGDNQLPGCGGGVIDHGGTHQGSQGVEVEHNVNSGSGVKYFLRDIRHKKSCGVKMAVLGLFLVNARYPVCCAL